MFGLRGGEFAEIHFFSRVNQIMIEGLEGRGFGHVASLIRVVRGKSSGFGFIIPKNLSGLFFKLGKVA